MKLQNMKLAQKWREYAGPKDERLEAENAKIYKLGFMLLSFGMLTLIFGGYPAQAVKKLASCFATVCCDGEC